MFLLSTPLPKVLGVQDHLFLLGRGLAHLRRPISSALVPERDLIGGLAQLIRGAYWLLALQPMVDLVEGAAGGSPTLLLHSVKLVEILRPNKCAMENKTGTNYYPNFKRACLMRLELPTCGIIG